MSIYLDHNATTAPEPAVLEAMNEVHRMAWGNPSAIHHEGQKARECLERCRRDFAKFLGLEKATEVVWTSGGTESNCTVLCGVRHYMKAQDPSRRKLIISAGEHPSVQKTAHLLAEQEDVVVCEIPLLANGQPDLSILEKELDDTVFLVSMMAANNETGAIFPVSQIGDLCRSKNVLFHTDAVNALSKMPVRVNEWPVDFVSFSGHKIHGPKGIGALIWKKSKIVPLMCGGGQERFRRAGTENVASVAGFVKALEVFMANESSHLETMAKNRDFLENEIKRLCEPVRVLAADGPRLANTSTICFPGVSAQTLLINLDLEGICVSSGSACSSGSLSPSHVLLSMGLSKTDAQSTIRISLGRHTTRKEIQQTVEVIRNNIQKIRGQHAPSRL